MPDIPENHRGPEVFQYLISPPGRGLDDRRRDEMAVALRATLDRLGSPPVFDAGEML